MTHFLTIPFRFGKATGDILSCKMRDFYIDTARMAYMDSSLLAESKTILTIPLSFDLVLDSGLICEIIEERLSAIEHQYVVIDISRPPEFVLATHHVIAGILRSITSDRTQNDQRRFLILISTMLPRDDVVMLAMAPLIDEGILSIIADNGDMVGLPKINSDDVITYQHGVKSVNIQPNVLLQKKLIRFPGHFKVSTSSGSACTKFYFDGRLCEREIVDLIDEFVADNYSTLDKLNILYDSVISRWCETAVLAFCERRKLTSWNTSLCITHQSFENLDQVLLILPLVDTGRTAGDLVSKITSYSPKAKITVLTILSTQGENNLIEPSPSTGPVPIHFLQRVMRVHYPPTQCPLCNAGVPLSNPGDPDPYTRLSSHAFWTLATDFGFGEERDVPTTYRPSVGQIPQLRRLEAENGAFLAYKVEKLLNSTGNLPVDPVVICPMEDGAQAIADYLELVFNMTVIRVPKHVLKTHTQPTDYTANRPAIQSAVPGTMPCELWEVQMCTLIEYRERIRARRPVFGSQQSNIIIMDELNVSGTTRTNLINFAAHYKLDVLCCVSVMDFSNDTQQALSLYDVNIPSPVASGT